MMRDYLERFALNLCAFYCLPAGLATAVLSIASIFFIPCVVAEFLFLGTVAASIQVVANLTVGMARAFSWGLLIRLVALSLAYAAVASFFFPKDEAA